MIVQEEIAPAIFELVLEGDMVEAKWKLDNFFIYVIPDDAHPCVAQFSISSIDKVNKNAILYIESKVLYSNLFNLKKCDSIDDVMGPWAGNGFDLSDLDKRIMFS